MAFQLRVQFLVPVRKDTTVRETNKSVGNRFKKTLLRGWYNLELFSRHAWYQNIHVRNTCRYLTELRYLSVSGFGFLLALTN